MNVFIVQREIAIIGHGQSLIGEGLGGYIDSHPVVLRFAKDPADAIVGMTADDFGKRTDILMFTETGRKRLDLDPRSRIKDMRLWCYDKNTGPDWELLKKYRAIKREDRAGHFSRGIAAVIMACQNGFDEISLFGFDNIVNRDNEQYLSCFRDLKLTRKYHDYDAERDILGIVGGDLSVEVSCYPKKLSP